MSNHTKNHNSNKFDPKNPPKNCTYLHEPLMLNIQNQKTEIWGSSCINPIIQNADLYISLDIQATVFAWENPWQEKNNQEHIRLFIPDMDVPQNDKEFFAALHYTTQALLNGKKVHVGCIAGHGRTGTFLAALAHITMQNELKQNNISAIDYVRDNYCAKAVETLSQVLYLHTVIGVDVPKKESSLIKSFKETFKKNINVDFNEVVNQAGFQQLKPVIENVEDEIYQHLTFKSKFK